VVVAYIKRGLAPIPIPPRSKNPNRERWQEERWTVEDVPRLWSDGKNVGILCGSPSRGRVDIDCDCLEAVRLAPKFLESTIKGGRDTVPGSHWWYTSPGCPSMTLKDVDGTTILELRSDGRQSLVYPSVHPEGDTYRWYKDLNDKMVRVEAEELQHRVRLLYAATVIARHMSPIGGRHDYALALAGFFLRNDRLGEDEARLVMVAAWSLFEDASREALGDVENAVKATAERLKQGRPVRGGGALAVFDERLTRTLADGCGWHLSGDEGTSYVWGAPEKLPENLPPVPEFDYQVLPDAFRGWVDDVATRMQVPPDFVATPLMVAFSAVVGRKVGMRPKRYDDWLVVANLWGAIVGKPGLMKSPALNEALAPMNALIARATENHKNGLEEYEAEQEICEARRQWYAYEKKKLAKKGDMVALQGFVEGNRPEDETEPPKERRYRTEDTTTEKLGELLNENPNGLMVFRDELVGFLRSLDKYGREGDRQFYLESWNGDQSFSVDRIGRGSLRVEALCLSVLGGIQPGPLSRYVREAGQGTADDDGLLPRFGMLVWPDPSRDWKNVDRSPDREAKDEVVGIFEFVDGLSYDRPEDASIPYLRFDTEAQVVFDAWRSELERELRSGELSPAMEAHKSKYRSLFPALALLIEIADRAAVGENPEWVTELSAVRAREWLVYLEGHATRLYSSADRPEMRSARELLKKLKAGEVTHGAPVRSIYKHRWTALRDRGEIDGALNILADHGWLRVHKVESGGRPSEVILLCPESRGAK
jgi:putative DNA primase/helicase